MQLEIGIQASVVVRGALNVVMETNNFGFRGDYAHTAHNHLRECFIYTAKPCIRNQFLKVHSQSDD